MKKEASFNNQDELEDFESKILEAKIEKIVKETERLKEEIEFNEKYQNKINACLEQRTGQIVTPYNLKQIMASLPPGLLNEILDEVFEKQHHLINSSNSNKKYSLVGKKPELNEYIPTQAFRSPLDILTHRSTSRRLEILQEQTSENTYRAHCGDIVYWHAWLSAIGFSFDEPITEDQIIAFIIQHAEVLDAAVDQKLVDQGYKNKLGPHKIATIKRRVASLSVYMESEKWNNPCYNKNVKELLQKLTKKYGGSKPTGKAITKDILDNMIETCGDTLIDKRDKALLLFTWGSGGRRRSEVTSADIKDLLMDQEGNYTYTIPQSKTDQEEKGHVVPVKGRVAQALTEWLHLAGLHEGPLFRAVLKGGKVGGALSDVDVYRIVKRRLKKAGYDETQYGAHSLRSGFVTEAGRRGKQLGDVMALTTHKNVGTVMKYYQAGNVINNSAADLAD